MVQYKSSAGFTLVELLISLFLGLFLIGGVLYALQNVYMTNRASNTVIEVQENGKTALDILLHDHQLAGFYGLFSNHAERNIAGSAPSDSTCVNGTVDWLTMLEQPIFGLAGSTLGYDCLSSSTHTNDSDVLVIRRADDNALLPGQPYSPNQWYIRTTAMEAELFQGSHAGLVTLDVEPFSDFGVVARAYFVGAGSNQCAGQSIPSLYRVATDAFGYPVIQELIPGIERLEARYLHNGQYKSAASISLDEWREVKEIKIWLLVRSVCPAPNLAVNQTIELPSSTYTYSDDYYRSLLTGMVSLRNISL